MSIFSQDPEKSAPLSPFAKERIETEIAHLRKGKAVRHAQQPTHSLGAAALSLIPLALLWLFFMDPVLYSFKRGEAIKAYLYEVNCGSDSKAREIEATGVFNNIEIGRLKARQGSFQDYYRNRAAAAESADNVVKYLNGLTYLHEGDYAKLDTVGRIRYQLFVRFGLHPPTNWDIFNPTID